MTRSPSRSATWLATAACLALGTACSEDESIDDIEDGFVVEDGKADDFLSVKAREFIVSGTARITVEANQGEAEVKKLIPHKHVALTCS